MEIRKDDYGYDITFNVKKPDNSIEDLSSATDVKFLVADGENFRNIVSGTCEITDAPNGKCKYTVQAEDFRKAGNYIGALKITKTESIVTTKDIAVTVKSSLE